MAVESATKDIQVTVSKNLSTTTIQGVKVEVHPDSNVVVYTNDGVQTKPAAASGEAAAKGTQISISEDFNTIVLNGAHRAGRGWPPRCFHARHRHNQARPGERYRRKTQSRNRDRRRDGRRHDLRRDFTGHAQAHVRNARRCAGDLHFQRSRQVREEPRRLRPPRLSCAEQGRVERAV